MIINHIYLLTRDFKSYNIEIWPGGGRLITIAELRAKNGKMSQRTLAREIDTTQTSISNWEKDPLSMNAENIVKLCLYFNVTSDEILGIKRE